MEKALFKLFRAAMTVYLWPRSARDKNLSVNVRVGLPALLNACPVKCLPR